MTGKGTISSLDLEKWPDGIEINSAIKLPEHLSYPFVVRDGQHVYCVPECAETGRVIRFALDEPSGTWRPTDPCVTAFTVVDPTLIKHHSVWWLFGGQVGRADYELCIWYADKLTGPWTPHPLNPVKTDFCSARPAGPLFTSRGELYRPAQDSSQGYGSAVAIQRVVELDQQRYTEEHVMRMEQLIDSPYRHGTHTLSIFSGGFIVDGKSSRFSLLTRFWRTVNFCQQKIRRMNLAKSRGSHVISSPVRGKSTR